MIIELREKQGATDIQAYSMLSRSPLVKGNHVVVIEKVIREGKPYYFFYTPYRSLSIGSHLDKNYLISTFEGENSRFKYFRGLIPLNHRVSMVSSLLFSFVLLFLNLSPLFTLGKVILSLLFSLGYMMAVIFYYDETN